MYNYCVWSSIKKMYANVKNFPFLITTLGIFSLQSRENSKKRTIKNNNEATNNNNYV